jgi:beta-lactam-binding protein with PASTA domain
MLKKTLKSVFNKLILLNLIIIMIIIMIGLLGLNFYLESYTLHNIEITVPDLRNFSINEVKPLLENRKLRYNIIDSNYESSKAAFVILDQKPKPNTKVKENRRIYLTINAKNPPQVKLPMLLDQSHRIAIEQLKISGLKADSLIYRPHFARDAVIGIMYKGSIIKEGEILNKGSSVNLIVGMGTSKEKVAVPNLSGLTVLMADELLMSNSLNLGRVFYDESIEDTISAQIYKQRPPDTMTNGKKLKLNLGRVIDVWLTQELKFDSTKIDN